MKAIVCQEYGPPEVLKLKEVEKPAPGDNEVLIRIYATSVTTGDCNARGFSFIPPGLGLLARLMLGFKKPKIEILGSVLSGKIESAGKNVSLFTRGDQVFGVDGEALGTYAEYVCMAEDSVLALKPVNMSHEEAAVIPFGALTALYFLREKGNIQNGQKVLINGASGNTGMAAVQIAKYFGAEVTGVCSTKNIDLVKTLGADKVIDYTKEDFTQNGESYDLIFDPVVGKTSFSASKKVMAPKGHYLAVAGGLKEMVQMLWTSIIGGRKVIFGGGMDCEKKEYLVFLKELIEAGHLKSVIDKSYSLEQMVEAHRYIESGEKKGNVAVTLI